MPLLLPILGFIFVSLLVAAAAMAFAPGGPGVIERRLEEFGGPQVKTETDGSYARAVDGSKRG